MKSFHYLNQSDGRKDPIVKRLPKDPQKNFDRLDGGIRNILNISKTDFLSYSQNLTTSLIYSILPIIQKSGYKVFLSDNEIRWFQSLFQKGKLPTNECTYPNYVKLRQVSFIKKDIIIFNPLDLVSNLKKIIGIKPSIIILSHVSRLTGEKLVNEKLYKELKGLNKNNIVVVDGSQAVGAIPINCKKISDIYLGLTSKYINAEPHVGFCYVNKELKKKFNIQPWTLDSSLYSREIYSAEQSLKKLVIDEKKTKVIRDKFEVILNRDGFDVSTTQNQVSYIVIIPWNRKTLKKAVEALKNKGYIVSDNIGYSVAEPQIPGIRISLTANTSLKVLKDLSKELRIIKNSETK